MKIGLITTTINAPKVLALYRSYTGTPDADISLIQFFVAGDEKTPPEAYEFCNETVFCRSYTPDQQRALGYRCSDRIGWNCIQRRNIALLEALKWGADIIVSIDDDNIPFPNYFTDFASVLSKPFAGIQFQAGSVGWFDAGALLAPKAKHRGFPLDVCTSALEPVANAKVGAAAGVCLGDPDIDAVTRMAAHPMVHSTSILLEQGITVASDTWTVFNSQNTAFIRELAPAMFMMPGVGRYDDIFASLICQRVMRAHGYHVHFGKPFVWQQRNDHNLLNDLKAEMYGMENTVAVADCLSKVAIDPGTTIVCNVAKCYQALWDAGLIPPHAVNAARAFFDDVEQVMK